MGELGAFLKIARASGARAPARDERVRRPPRVRRAAPARRAARAGRALHGVRRPVLPQRLPARESHPRLERPRLPRPLPRGARPAAPHEQLPRVHRPALPRAVRGGVRARDRRGQRRRRSSRSSSRSSSAAGTRAGSSRSRRARGRAARWRSSARARPGSRARSSSTRAGHAVTVFERDEAGGGLLRFGVPDFKIEKRVVERRLAQLAAEGVEFRCGVDVDRRPRRSCAAFDAVVLATGSRVPRDLPVPGRELDGVHFAMEYLYGRNRAVAGTAEPAISAAGQARDRHRRRRHRRRLRRERAPRRRRVGDADRAARRAAGAPARRPDAVAALADEAAHVVRAEGGRRAELRDLDHRAHRQRARVEQIHWARNSGAPPFEPLPGSE